MIVTRTESYSDWVYQGAYAGELAASVGVGLFKGFIYFRHAHDNLQAGHTIDREEFFVELSDGTKYLLGTGLSGEKIQVLNHGVTNDGNVHLEVIGNEDIGVGVSRITRNVTISFDDGKVPVLDTEQLNEILGSLEGSLTDSMKNTAEAVKTELRDELATKVEDVRQECSKATATVNGNVIRIEGELSDKITSASLASNAYTDATKTELAGKITSLEKTIEELRGLTKYRSPVARWNIPVTSIPSNNAFNLLDKAPSAQFGSGEFKYNDVHKSINISEKAFGIPRIFRVDLSLNISTSSDFDGDLAIVLWDKSDGGEVIGRAFTRIDYDKLGGGSRISFMQLSASLYVGGNAKEHPLTKNGVSVHLHNYGVGDLTIQSGSTISLSLT